MVMYFAQHQRAPLHNAKHIIEPLLVATLCTLKITVTTQLLVVFCNLLKNVKIITATKLIATSSE